MSQEQLVQTEKPGATTAEKKPTKSSPVGLMIAVVGGLVILAAVYVVGYLPRAERARGTEKAAEAEESAIPVVNVTKVRQSSRVSSLLLPGTITPLIEAPIYARASGYVVKRYVDIGDQLRHNQLMAVIDAPDLDQQVAQGRAGVSQARQQLGQSQAALQQAKAQLDLAKITWDRYAKLVEHGAVARQDADIQKTTYETAGATVSSAQANVRAAEDNVQAAQANLDRLIALQSFKEVRAPFAGVVTARNIDVGSYVSPAGGQSGVTTYSQAASATTQTQNGALFTLAQNERLRILINVPQSEASGVQVGQGADVSVQNYRNRRFAGKVTRTSNSLDASTRTLLVEVQVDNKAGALLPGMYADVQFSANRANPPMLIPGDSLITRSNGQFVAILVDMEDGKEAATPAQRERAESGANKKSPPKQIHMQPVQVGRDNGTDTEVLTGLQGWEYVVSNPSDDVYEGALVTPMAAPRTPSQSPPVKSARTPDKSAESTKK